MSAVSWEDVVAVVEAATAQRVSWVGLKARILRAVLAGPDALTEDRLAQALVADRENVADACGAMLLDDVLVMNPDGTYRRGPKAAA